MLGKFNEIHFSSPTLPRESEGRVIKGIMRTGEWAVTPTAAGRLQKPLKIVKSGRSNVSEGILSLEHLVGNFGKAIGKVQVPFADDQNDEHVIKSNMAKVNKGFVVKIWVEDEPERGPDEAQLMAEFNFTDEEAKAQALAGSVADVSSGIVEVVKDGIDYGTCLHHVCMTNSPFMDRLHPWMMATDEFDVKEGEIVTVETADAPPVAVVPDTTPAAVAHTLTYKQVLAAAQTALERDLNLTGFTVDDASAFDVVVKSDDKSWKVSYSVEADGTLRLPFRDKWLPSENVVAPTVEPPVVPASPEVKAEAERRVVNTINKEGENIMAGIDLSKIPEDQREAVAAAVAAKETAERTAREAEVDSRVDALSKMPQFSDNPGFLKYYRKVALGKVQGDNILLFSDNGKEAKEFTPREILDHAIDNFSMIETVSLSDQAQRSGADIKPPETDQKSDEDRHKEAKSFLYND
jgi:hypothetical protein